jgi:signal transduction histidine kinase
MGFRDLLFVQTAINRELKRARLAGAALAGQHFTLNEEIPALIQVMRKVYATKNLDIQLHLSANKIFQADREDMLELFGNLLDNACKWAKYCVTVTAPIDLLLFPLHFTPMVLLTKLVLNKALAAIF